MNKNDKAECIIIIYSAFYVFLLVLTNEILYNSSKKGRQVLWQNLLFLRR